ncbi:MAG: hypothetical protein K2F87_06565 [Muribaculaceae bacterium]|nr:hypothetical protein [Muribaculaceae bacterium]
MGIEKTVGLLKSHILQPLASLAKVALRSKRPSGGGKPLDRPLIIMGNGPSLRSFIDSGPDLREGFALMAVNFAANAPEFRGLRPQLYILADPHFFNGHSTDPNVTLLWQHLSSVSWRMTLWLPLSHKAMAWPLLGGLPDNVKVKWFNLTPVEGRGPLSRALIKGGWGMPRPRNVLIPAIMTALRAGYREIYLVGADHTWSRSLWVDDMNRVVSVQPHFYKDNEKEARRVAGEYAGYHLHDILGSLTVAFRSYFDIAEHASRLGATIFNATPGSFIDAFPRCDYERMRQRSWQ